MTIKDIIEKNKTERLHFLHKSDLTLGEPYPVLRVRTRSGRYGLEAVFTLVEKDADGVPYGVSTRMLKADNTPTQLGTTVQELIENGYGTPDGAFAIVPKEVTANGNKGISFDIITIDQ
ncbi:MAG: hypothetical protein J6T77_02670 [Clostridia bacterium]|nr:hypothetical protein [Clostridia bacterium]